MPSERENQQPSEEAVGRNNVLQVEDVKKFSAEVFLVCSVRQSAFLDPRPEKRYA